MIAATSQFLVRRARTLLIGAGVVILGFAAMVATGHLLSRSPRFCGTCHYEEPFVEEWKTSSHAEVPCWRCHDQEGILGIVARQTRNAWNTFQYLIGAYGFTPRAEIRDGACTQQGCHEDRRLSGPVTMHIDRFAPPTRPLSTAQEAPPATRPDRSVPAAMPATIEFDHAAHLDDSPRGIRMPCVACHSRIVQGEHMTVTKESCYLCHFKDLPSGVAVAGCKCHGSPDAPVEHKGFSMTHEKFVGLGMKCSDCHLDVTAGDGRVPETRCSRCHLWRDVQKYDRATIHDTHVTDHDVPCDRCHEPIEHRQVTMVRTLEVGCATCHVRTHDPHRELYMGVGARGVDPLPDMMFKAQVACDGCHRDVRIEGRVRGDVVAKGTREACVECHGVGYDRMLDDWRTLLGGAMAALERRREDAAASLSGVADGKARAEAGDRLARADFNLRFLREGRPEHNVLYAERVMSSIQDDLDAVLLAARPGEPPASVLPFPKEAVTARCTETCHTNMDKVLRVRHGDLELSHRDHIYKHGLQCMYCHDNSTRHGAVRLERSQCVHCHHVQQQAECGTACHRRQAAFLKGEGGFDVQPTPDPMAGQVSCGECHADLAHGHDPARIRGSCADCHDEKYRDMPARWQEGVKARMDAILQDIERAEASRSVPASALIKARGNVALIQEDRSRGAHNPGFAGKLLDAAAALLKPVRPDQSR